MSVEGKVVIVTGAARGIGQEYVRALAAAGARPVAADVSDCSETIELAKAAGGNALGVKCDVADASSTDAMVAAASKAFGRVDALINNAALYGGLRGGRFETITEADWDAAMTINVKGIWNCCKSAVPALRAAGGGSIINIASLAATFGTPFVLHYTTSKAAVIGMTRGLARAVITEGTREFFANKLDKALDVVKSGQAIQRNLQPSDLSGTILWLVADTSAFVTGQTISVDGGTVMN